ncbi:MAG: DegT/DnrJ/EryC1/StrS family aminotransferase [Patescibacteria group bacterium]
MINTNDRRRLQALVRKIMRAQLRRFASDTSKVHLSWPVYDDAEILNALDSLLELRLSQGPKVKEFEQRFADYLGVRYATAVNSGSSANLLALAALVEHGKIKKGAEVIVPAATFSAVASPVLHLGLVPVYVDVERDTWNINPLEIKKAITPRTRIIMAVHTFGNPANMPAIMRIAKNHKLFVIEDCCEAHGARIGAKKVGSFGDLATMSFFIAHNMTTGEGGMVFTQQKKLQTIVSSLREFGRLPADVIRTRRLTYRDPVLGYYDARYITTRLGFNVRMTDLTAALGIEQLKKLDGLNRRRLRIVNEYTRFLKPYRQFIQLPTRRPATFHNYYGFTIVVRPDAPFTRRELSLFLEKNSIETRPFFDGCLPDQPAFRTQPHRSVGKLPVSRLLRDNAIFIGCHPALTSEHIRLVRKAFTDFFEHHVNHTGPHRLEKKRSTR